MAKIGLTIGIIILLLILFILINPTFVNPAFPEKVQTIMTVYVALLALILASFDQKLPLLGTGIGAVVWFVVGFVATSFIVILIPQSVASSFEALQVVSGVVTVIFGLLFIFVKAFVEEIVFRGILADKLGGVVQAGLFGLFHAGVLTFGGASLPAILFGMFFLAFLGYVWYMMSRADIMLAVGSHFAWNMHAFGLLASFLPAIGMG